MFRNAAVAEAGEIDVIDVANLIPLSHLALDLDPPAVGWAAYLTGRGIEIVLDSVGRKAISSDDARQLFTERRESEARKREAMAQQEQRAIEQDQQFRAQVWGGVRADHMPPGAAPAAVMLQAAKDAEPRRLTPLQEALTREGMTFHSLAPTPGDDAA